MFVESWWPIQNWMLGILVLLVISQPSRGDEPIRKDSSDRILALRDFLMRGSPMTGLDWGDRQKTALALVSIVNSESQPGGDWGLKCAALELMARFGDMESVSRVLFRELSYKRTTWKGSPPMPLDWYPAARAMSRLGAGIRDPILGVIWRDQRSDHELALRAHILVELDEEREVTVYRLRRILEQCQHPDDTKSIPVPSNVERRQIGEQNLNRMIAMLLHPDFRFQQIPDPAPSRGDEIERSCKDK